MGRCMKQANKQMVKYMLRSSFDQLCCEKTAGTQVPTPKLAVALDGGYIVINIVVFLDFSWLTAELSTPMAQDDAAERHQARQWMGDAPLFEKLKETTWWYFDFDQSTHTLTNWTSTTILFWFFERRVGFYRGAPWLWTDFQVNCLMKWWQFASFPQKFIHFSDCFSFDAWWSKAEAARLRAEIEQLVQRAAGLRPNYLYWTYLLMEEIRHWDV